MLSRSFIINASSLLLPLYQKSLKLKKRSDTFFFIFVVVLIVFTLISIFSVNHYRLIKLETIKSGIIQKEMIKMNNKKKDLEKIILCDVQNKIYPNLEKAFLNLLTDSGYEGIKLEKRIDFNKLYNERKN